MEYVLALDQGSGSSKACLVSESFRIVHISSVPLRTYRKSPLWAEHSPAQILSSQLEAVRATLRKARSGSLNVNAVGLAGQRSTVLLWDRRTGKPLCPAISWQDLRAEADLEVFSAYQEAIREKTGLLLSPHYSALKIRWALKNIRGARSRAESGKLLCGSVNSFILWHLSRGELHVIDPTQAGRLLLLNLRTLSWDAELLEWLDIPQNILPAVIPTVSDFGEIRIMGRTLPIRASVGDQQAALVGLGGLCDGDAVINYGTGGFVVVNTGGRAVVIPGLLTALAWNDQKRKRYQVEGTVNSVGSVLEWIRAMGLARSWSEMDSACAAGSGEILVLPALTGMGAPYWIGKMGMSIEGIRPATNQADILRGVMEGIAFLVRNIFDRIQSSRKPGIHRVAVGGGVSRLDSLMQIQADSLGRSLFRPGSVESTLAGAGMLAGMGSGGWDLTGDRSRTARGTWFHPQRNFEARYQKWKETLDAHLRITRHQT